MLVRASVDERVDEGGAPEEDGGGHVQARQVVARRHRVEDLDETRRQEAGRAGRDSDVVYEMWQFTQHNPMRQ